MTDTHTPPDGQNKAAQIQDEIPTEYLHNLYSVPQLLSMSEPDPKTNPIGAAAWFSLINARLDTPHDELTHGVHSFLEDIVDESITCEMCNAEAITHAPLDVNGRIYDHTPLCACCAQDISYIKKQYDANTPEYNTRYGNIRDEFLPLIRTELGLSAPDKKYEYPNKWRKELFDTDESPSDTANELLNKYEDKLPPVYNDAQVMSMPSRFVGPLYNPLGQAAIKARSRAPADQDESWCGLCGVEPAIIEGPTSANGGVYMTGLCGNCSIGPFDGGMITLGDFEIDTSKFDTRWGNIIEEKRDLVETLRLNLTG